jgi:hypothetical protein
MVLLMFTLLLIFSICVRGHGQFTIETEEVEVEVNLRPTASRPVCPGVRRPSGTSDQFFPFSLKFSLDSCGFVIL